MTSVRGHNSGKQEPHAAQCRRSVHDAPISWCDKGLHDEEEIVSYDLGPHVGGIRGKCSATESVKGPVVLQGADRRLNSATVIVAVKYILLGVHPTNVALRPPSAAEPGRR